LLGKRVISATVGSLFLITVIYLGGWYYNLAVLGIIIVALNEVYNALEVASLKPIRFVGYIFVTLFIPIFLTRGIVGVFVLFMLLSLGAMISMFIGSNTNFSNLMATLFPLIYPVLPLSFLIIVKYLRPEPVGILALSTIFIASWLTDTFAYFVGTRFGKHKLCPNISPNKTIEGAVGGFIGSGLFTILLGFLVQNFYYNQIPWYHYGILGILCGIAAQFGDLSASSIKRSVGIKDYGSFFPGHGGILDRFDSVIFTIPVVYSYFSLILLK